MRIKGSIENFKKQIEAKGYKEVEHFILNDTFLIPKDLEIEKSSVTEIVSKALIIREVRDITHNETRKDISFKIKNINDKGDILEQKSTRMKIHNCEEAENFFKVIGYKKIMNITEEDFGYEKDGVVLTIKDVKNGDNMIEIETQRGNDKCNNVEKLKKWLANENLDLDYSNYFVKKAEVELNKILKRRKI